MSISNLPSVLIEEIFARVPLKSLRAVRYTCKNWNTLSKSESFIKMYTSKAATSTREKEKALIIAMIRFNLYLMKVVVGDPIIKFKPKPSFLSEQVRAVSQVFNCEGLLLCILKDDTTRVVVWNPYYGQTRWIKPRFPHRTKRCIFTYSLGYKNNESSRSHKLLRFIDFLVDATEKFFCWYEIYDLDSGLWTTLDVTTHFCICSGDCGVSLKGNTYWCATGWISEDSIIDDHIVCFDFTTERFGALLPLPSSNRDLNRRVTLSCVKEEKLAALFQQRETEVMEIWITTKIDVEMVSWSKFLTIHTGPDMTFIDRGFLIDEEKKVAMGFLSFGDNSPNLFSIIGEDGYLDTFDLEVPAAYAYSRPDVFSYVPSLVEIKTLAQGKKKRQSSLEKRRFDQVKLRLEEFEAIRMRRQKKERLI